MTVAQPVGTPYTLSAGEGRSIWFLGTLMTVIAGDEQTGGAYTLIDATMPAGFGPPPHIHRAEDELFFMLEGKITVYCGEETWELEPGMAAFLPKGVVHRFVVSEDGPARMLQLTNPAGFEHFAAEVGEPATEAVLPPPSVPDIAKLVSVAAQHNIDILPPAGD